MILSEIIRNISPYRHLLVGFSGGLDSTVLLHCLKILSEENNIKLRAVHIHHGLSKYADNWAKHCIELCSKWEIPIVIMYVSVIKKGLGIEAQARKVRYEAFKKILLPKEVLITAHHLDDQCKTFFLALKRGSGPAGLSAMPTRIKFASTQLIRPLLNETRESLITWAKKYSLHWIEDESNQNDYFDRNFLHLRIMPLLSKRWPYISSTVSRSAALCAEQECLLDELLANELSTLISKDGAIKIIPLKTMSAPHRCALLRRWLSKQGALMPSRSMLNRIWLEVAQARESATPCIHLNGYDIRRFNGMLWRVKKQHICKDTVLLWRDFSKPLVLPNKMGYLFFKDNGHISPPLPRETVNVRFKAEGMIHTVGYHKERSLKEIWQELHIPLWERSVIPLIFYDEKLITAVGKFITKQGWVKSSGISFEKET